MDARPRQVAIVRARYNPYGGAERFVQRALAALASGGAEVTVIARRWTPPRDGEAAVPMRLLRVDPFHLGSLWHDWSFARGVRRALAGRSFDIVQSHERIAGLPLYRAGDGVHAEYLAQRRRAEPGWRAALTAASPYHRYVLAAERAMFTHPALRAVICNSEMVRGEIHSRFGVPMDKLHLVRNGVDLERFRPPTLAERSAAREGLGLEPGRTVFAYVGSGFARKGLAASIRALAAMPGARGVGHPAVAGAGAGAGAIPRTCAGIGRAAAEAAIAAAPKPLPPVLLVAGADRKLAAHRALAGRLGVAGQVRFLGGVDDVRPVLWAADAFVLPTLYDPFPNAVLEALACGLPAVTSTRSGAAEFIRAGENGFVVDALDIGGIARALDALADPQGRGARAAAARASVAPLSLDALGAQLIALYRRLIESPAP
ncbi:MAG: glycosyltransferase family 4 protein [Gammaproteobacteria bacterium]